MNEFERGFAKAALHAVTYAVRVGDGREARSTAGSIIKAIVRKLEVFNWFGRAASEVHECCAELEMTDTDAEFDEAWSALVLAVEALEQAALKTPGYDPDGFESAFKATVALKTVDADPIRVAAARELLVERGIGDDDAGPLPTSVVSIENFLAASEIAARWFEEQLRSHRLWSYAEKEIANPAFDLAALGRFRLGYAPPGWEGLREVMAASGRLEEAVAAGLIATGMSERKHFDRFRHRLMFPIRDPKGRVVGFMGRALGSIGARPVNDPKYIATPDTPICTKGAHLFGLYQAQEAIRDHGHAVVVEGIFDVVTLHALGMRNVVSGFGRALTPEQINALAMQTGDVRLVFDGHAGGEEQARRAPSAFANAAPEVEVTARILPKGASPRSLVRVGGIEALRKYVQ